MNEDEILIKYVFSMSAKNPSLVPRIIEAATKGVQEFANKQKDFGSKLGFAMTMVVDNTSQDNFGPFTRVDLIEMTKPWFEGTKWWEEKQLELISDNK